MLTGSIANLDATALIALAKTKDAIINTFEGCQRYRPDNRSGDDREE